MSTSTSAAIPSVGTATSVWLWRLRHTAVFMMFLAVSLNTASGQIVSDTKLDLTLNPAGLLSRGTNLWEPLGSAGQVQDQGYGYLFPMGPLFDIAARVGLPAWVTQRLWWAVLLGVSYAGFVLLASRLHIGSRWAQVVAGTAFALWPHVLTILGRSSVEAWPVAWSPWVVLPLVGPAALARPVRAAALSGLAVLAMGGVNATVDLAAVLPAMLWLASRRWGWAWLRLCLTWVVTVGLASLWWVVPLLSLRRFSPPFLDFIESASITTRTTALVEVLRGTSDWVAYLGDASTRAGGMLLTRPTLIVGTIVVTALGLGGIALAERRVRGWLALLLIFGAVLGTLGYIGSVGSPAAAELQRLLDGPLAPLRNIHKFDILVRLAVSLGLAAALDELARAQSRAETRLLRPVVAAGASFAVVTAASPFFALATAPGASYEAVPGYWSEAATWLGQHGPTGRTLLAPGSRFADYDWGSTGDEPMQALAVSGWDVRNAIPLTSVGHIRWLDELEGLFAMGRGGSDLAAALREGGITHVLVRNDLSIGVSAATRPLLAEAALAATPGVHRVVSFGPVVGGWERGLVIPDEGLQLPARAINIYSVETRGDPRVSATPLSQVAEVSGSAESVLGRGLDGAAIGVSSLDPTTAQVADEVGRHVLTDTPRLRETNFGIGAFGSSQTLSPHDPLRLDKPVLDYTSWSRSAAATASIRGVDVLRASSSSADADAYPRTDPGTMPYAAVDGDPTTAWRPNRSKPARGSWWEMELPIVRTISGTVTVEGPGPGGITELTLVTDVGTTRLPVVDGRAALPEVRTRLVRLQLSGVLERPVRDVGIREVTIPGLTVRRSVVIPSTGSSPTPDRVWLQADTGGDGCVDLGGRPLCAPALVKSGEDAAGLNRTVTLGAMAASVSLRAVPRPGAALDEAVSQALHLGVNVTATSRAVAAPAAGPIAAIDGSMDTAWLSSGDDPAPSLTLAWKGKRTIDHLRVVLDRYVGATASTGVEVRSSDGHNRKALLDPGGLAEFAPITTDALTIRFVANPYSRSIDPYTLRNSALGIGVSELEVPGVTGAVSQSGAAGARRVEFPCGSGPTLDIGGRRLRTSVSTTVSDLLSAREASPEVCGDAIVAIPAGIVRVAEEGGTDRAWSVTDLLLDRAGGASRVAPTAASPSVTVTSWGAGARGVTIGARTEPVLLAVHENANAGWLARIGGTSLAPITVNGWQQGYLVPAGPAAHIDLEFSGNSAMRAGMLAGALGGGVLVVAGLAILVAAYRRRSAREAGGRHCDAGLPDALPEVPVLGALVVLLVALAGLWAVLAGASVTVAWAILRHWPRASRWGHQAFLAWVAAVAYLGAGVLLVSGHLGSATYRAGSAATQVLALTALTAVAVAVTPARWWHPGGL